MNFKRFIKVAMLLAGSFLLFTALAAADENVKSPKAFFPETEFHFDPIMDGTKISHTFVVENQGEAPLDINKVKTG